MPPPVQSPNSARRTLVRTDGILLGGPGSSSSRSSNAAASSQHGGSHRALVTASDAGLPALNNHILQRHIELFQLLQQQMLESELRVLNRSLQDEEEDDAPLPSTRFSHMSDLLLPQHNPADCSSDCSFDAWCAAMEAELQQHLRQQKQCEKQQQQAQSDAAASTSGDASPSSRGNQQPGCLAAFLSFSSCDRHQTV